MFIVLINWRIKPDQVGTFLEKWKTTLKLDNAEGLIGEYLSKVENAKFDGNVTWEMEPDDRDSSEVRSTLYVSYVNVGIWNSAKDFSNAVGKYMSVGREIKEDFEAAPRRRAFLTPKCWRDGQSELPIGNSSGVES